MRPGSCEWRVLEGSTRKQSFRIRMRNGRECSPRERGPGAGPRCVTMPTALSLFLPAWPIDLLRRRDRSRLGRRWRSARPDRSAIQLMNTIGGRQHVVTCCERAAAAGVRPGMDVAHARALLPTGDVRLAVHRPERDLAALHALAEWAERFAPVVSSDSPDGLLMDVSGCERLYSSVGVLVDRLASRPHSQPCRNSRRSRLTTAQ